MPGVIQSSRSRTGRRRIAPPRTREHVHRPERPTPQPHRVVHPRRRARLRRDRLSARLRPIQFLLLPRHASGIARRGDRSDGAPAGQAEPPDGAAVAPALGRRGSRRAARRSNRIALFFITKTDGGETGDRRFFGCRESDTTCDPWAAWLRYKPAEAILDRATGGRRLRTEGRDPGEGQTADEGVSLEYLVLASAPRHLLRREAAPHCRRRRGVTADRSVGSERVRHQLLPTLGHQEGTVTLPYSDCL